MTNILYMGSASAGGIVEWVSPPLPAGAIIDHIYIMPSVEAAGPAKIKIGIADYSTGTTPANNGIEWISSNISGGQKLYVYGKMDIQLQIPVIDNGRSIYIYIDNKSAATIAMMLSYITCDQGPFG